MSLQTLCKRMQTLAADGWVDLCPPADAGQLLQLAQQLPSTIGLALPWDYAQFLGFSNGLQIQNSEFFSADELISRNQDLDLSDVLVLGVEGNTAMHLYDSRDGLFHTTALGGADARFGSFSSFEALLTGVLNDQGCL